MSATTGTVTTAETIFCTRCGSAYKPAQDRFCSGCGMSLTTKSPEPTIPEKKQGDHIDYFLILGATLWFFLFFAIFDGPSAALGVTLFYILIVLLTWAIWHFMADKIVKIAVHGLGSGSKLLYPGRVKQVYLIDELPASKNHIRFLLRRSLLPLVLVIGTSGTLRGFLGKTLGPPTVSSLAITTALISLLVYPLISIFVVPVTWVLDSVGIRFLNEKKRTIETFRINPIWQNLISIGTLASFLFYLFTLPSTDTGSPDPIRSLDVLIRLVLILYPPAIILTTLYYRYSLSKHLSRAHQSFDKRGVRLVEWPAFRKEGISWSLASK